MLWDARRRVRLRNRSRSAIANVAWRVILAHFCWSRTCPHVIAYGLAWIALTGASFTAGARAGASLSCPPHAPTSAAAVPRVASAVMLPLSDLIMYLLLA